MKQIKYNKVTKKFETIDQKSLSAYSYKTPEVFIKEKRYKGNEILSDNDIFQLGKEYIQNQIVSFDEKLMHKIINHYRTNCNKYNEVIDATLFPTIMVAYAKFSGSQKLKFLVELWLKD